MNREAAPAPTDGNGRQPRPAGADPEAERDGDRLLADGLEAADRRPTDRLAADLRLIRQRLSSDAIRDPRVSAELHELFQRAVALTEIGERRGRHRAGTTLTRPAAVPSPARDSTPARGSAPVRTTPVCDAASPRRTAPAREAAPRRGTAPFRDTHDFRRKPNPLTARTAAALVASLREYRDWAGHPSLRTMAVQARRQVGASTIGAALNRDDLPTYKVTVAIVEGCGGGPGDREAYAAAWRQIKSGPLGTRPAGRRPALRVVPPAASASG